MAKPVGKPMFKCPACGKMVRKTTKDRLESHIDKPHHLCIYSGQTIKTVEVAGENKMKCNRKFLTMKIHGLDCKIPVVVSTESPDIGTTDYKRKKHKFNMFQKIKMKFFGASAKDLFNGA